ncbi:MAG: hypothetical protein WDM89_15175 [Rhizomicrobium sp.]
MQRAEIRLRAALVVRESGGPAPRQPEIADIFHRRGELFSALGEPGHFGEVARRLRDQSEVLEAIKGHRRTATPGSGDCRSPLRAPRVVERLFLCSKLTSFPERSKNAMTERGLARARDGNRP